MTKKIILSILTIGMCATAFYSCRKTNSNTGDQTLNYFPLQFGKTVTYNVDSIIYDDANCTQRESRTQLKYAITDTFRDSKKRLSYIMDVFSRPHDGAVWQKARVITITPAIVAPTTTTPPPNTPTNSLIFSEIGVQFIRLEFPIVEGNTWKGNALVPVLDTDYAYFNNWNYVYQNVYSSFNTGFMNFDNTVTVLENNESVYNPQLDTTQYAYRTYAKEVYGYNVGMVYKEWTHYIYHPNHSTCVKGYTVIMRAIDHN
ncbi:hypothetical protein CJD36_016585 [Flavipsychrobacter stenotrophus]|uniref:Uncharacterized protein n=1 Tax=Flavipsychrobacter stenotrophus TaxID=2077091 RepID=A0A2S7SU94_9BACT|nr:hypothetical protein [Flavipsychrobacter stenotrophus]PQJ10298.1 hypothetical protein CJD36_016585 [Flavipsychrobacter stenotrophus]